MGVTAVPPALILHSHRHQGVAVARTLGRLGVPVYCVESGALAPSFFSRYCRGRFVRPTDRAHPEALAAALVEIAGRIGSRPVLIAATDAAAAFVSTHASTLEQGFLFPRVPIATLRALASKKEMYFAALRCGVPTPAAAFPQSLDDVAAFAAEAEFPVVLKRIDTSGGGPAPVRVAIARDKAGLLDRYRTASAGGEFMLQEYIPGGDDTIWMFNGYFNADSECLFAATGKKLRQYPVHTGATSLGVCLPNRTVADLTIGFMKAMRYRGMLDVGYRYDARDRQYKVLDVNPRLGATFRLFVSPGGTDVVRACYLDLTGQTVPGAAAQTGRKWLLEDLDLISCWRYYREGTLSLRRWLASYRGIDEWTWFAADDPLPLLAGFTINARGLARRAAARATQSIATVRNADRRTILRVRPEPLRYNDDQW